MFDDDDGICEIYEEDEFEPLPRPIDNPSGYYIGFETAAERESRLEREAEAEEEAFDCEEREYNAKLAAQRDFDPSVYDSQLEKLPQSPEAADTAWMTEEERKCVAWFDRGDYDTFMKRSAWYPGGGWIVQYCRYMCGMMRLASDEVLCSPANDLLTDRELLGRFIDENARGYYEKAPVRNYEDMDRRERFLYVADGIFQAAEAGNARAQNATGILYERREWHELKEHFDKHRHGCSSSDGAAREWYRKSAEGGCVRGLRNYARVLMDGIGAERGNCAEAERVAEAKRDRKRAMDLYLDLAGRGDVKSQYRLACLFAEGVRVKKDIPECARWLRMAARGGHKRSGAVVAAAGDDTSDERLFAELLILLRGEQVDRSRNEPECDYSVKVTPESRGGSEAKPESAPEGDDWLLKDKPPGTVLPPSAGRDRIRVPNLTSANPSFAARLITLVRDRFGGDAPAIYKAAHVSRKTYSSIISNELRPVAKDTAVAFALALRLSPMEADELLGSAGFSFSQFYIEDIIVKTCIIAGIYDIDRVNAILAAHGAKTFCKE